MEEFAITMCRMAMGTGLSSKAIYEIIDIGQTRVLGMLKVRVDDGKGEKVHSLENPSMDLYISKMVGKEMYNFSEDNVLLVIASQH